MGVNRMGVIAKEEDDIFAFLEYLEMKERTNKVS